jgi:hypothetical protein
VVTGTPVTMFLYFFELFLFIFVWIDVAFFRFLIAVYGLIGGLLFSIGMALAFGIL